MATRRIEKKFTGFKDKSSIKLNTPASTFKKAPATQSREFEPAPPTRSIKNLTRFKKSTLI